MNIEQSVKEIEKIKEIFIHLRNYGWINDIKKEIDIDKVIEAIETLLTAYEEKCKELKKEIQDDLDVRNRWGLTLQELEKEKEDNKRLRKCHLQYEEMTGIDLLLPKKEK